MTLLGLWLLLILGFCLGRYAEYRIHKQNYEFLMHAGAEELVPRRMRRFYNLVFLCLPIALLEAFWVRLPVTPDQVVAGVALLGGGALLRLWAIKSMGRLWTMRCIFLPGAPVSRKGPYKLLRHPEYVSRILDGIGLFVVIGSFGTAILYAAIAGYQALAIATTEQRQLSELKGKIDPEEQWA